MKNLLCLILIVLFAAPVTAQNTIITEIMSANITILADEDDDYEDWIEIFNTGEESVNLEGYGLSDNDSEPFKWVFPNIEIQRGDYLLVFASGKNKVGQFVHTNFKLKSEGEIITLSDPSGGIVDQVDSGYIPSDISRGKRVGAGQELYYFQAPSPRMQNHGPSFLEISESPEFLQLGGIFNGSVTIPIESSGIDAEIYYTRDGSTPTKNSFRYSAPLVAQQSVVIRARVFEHDKLPSTVITNSYMFYENNDLPIISLSTDPDNFFSEDYGIYVMGRDPGLPPNYPHANFWQDWERPVHVEMYEPDGTLAFSVEAGVKIRGEKSRLLPQKSLTIKMKDKYGDDKIEYRIFENKDIDEFESIILRNSGQDWMSTLMRDAMMANLIEDSGIDHLAYRPAIMFINGEYWGIHNIREQVSVEYLASNHEIDKDEIDLLEYGGQVIDGDSLHYMALLEYVRTHDMRLEESYQYVATQMDIENFIKYWTAETYYGNTDWPANNIKFWRPQTPTGVWKWIMFDTDYGFGLRDSYELDTIELFMDGNRNPPWAVLLINSLMQNQYFKEKYINYFADFINLNFRDETVISLIETMTAGIESEIAVHQLRWGRPLDRWYEELTLLRNFAANRPSWVKNHILHNFNLPGIANVRLDISSSEAGKIRINSSTVTQYPWDGDYFVSIPIELAALPSPGYRFVRWEGIDTEDTSFVRIPVLEDLNITAIFEEDNSNLVMINEINYNSSDEFDPKDWVELYNHSLNNVDISGWVFKDANDDNEFIIPENAVLQTGEYIVLCKDSEEFSTLYPDVENYIGDLDFNLSNGGELIRLFNAEGLIIDSLTYDDELPWPLEPDGNGPTLELIDAELPNHFPASWQTSVESHGTPGRANGSFNSNGDIFAGAPHEFRLRAPSPNPFNAAATINFSLLKNGMTSLIVYDVQGREVKRLVDGFRTAGSYNVVFDGSILSSGVYFARLTADTGVQTQKMLLIK